MKSFKISGVLLLIDCLASLLLHNYAYPTDVLGDILLIEAAGLFLAAGVMDFGSSLGFVQFRKTMSSSKEHFSSERRKVIERRALVLVLSGSTLLMVLILLAIVTV
jgi:hypothetical protein